MTGPTPADKKPTRSTRTSPATVTPAASAPADAVVPGVPHAVVPADTLAAGVPQDAPFVPDAAVSADSVMAGVQGDSSVPTDAVGSPMATPPPAPKTRSTRPAPEPTVAAPATPPAAGPASVAPGAPTAAAKAPATQVAAPAVATKGTTAPNAPVAAAPVAAAPVAAAPVTAAASSPDASADASAAAPAPTAATPRLSTPDVAGAVDKAIGRLREHLTVGEIVAGLGALIIVGIAWFIFGFIFGNFGTWPTELVMVGSVALLGVIAFQNMGWHDFGSSYRLIVAGIGVLLGFLAALAFLSALRGAISGWTFGLGGLTWWAGSVVAAVGGVLVWREND
jgi:hypothetical protein